MSLLNFPNSPSTGDTYSFGAKTWEWDGSSWTIYNLATQSTAEVIYWKQITGGASGCNRSIATAKGWTVSG
jgi:hypothetical protein